MQQQQMKCVYLSEAALCPMSNVIEIDYNTERTPKNDEK